MFLTNIFCAAIGALVAAYMDYLRHGTVTNPEAHFSFFIGALMMAWMVRRDIRNK